MAGGYSTPNVDPLDQLRSELADAKRRLDELERPTGSQLAQTVANLQSLLSNQVTPLVGSASASSFTVTPSQTTFLTVNMTVPAGYTRALVTANSTGSMVPITAANDRLYSTITIAGNAGVEVFGFADNQIGGGVAAAHAVSVSGLTPGNNMATTLAMHSLLANSGTGTATRAVLTVSALFLK